ncbi:hypothetical protein [Desulfovibrio piger]|uniref:hypothetical protein n=1 Tax=Desulfovibrio piger TaxID=901 RepID=UPI0026F04F4E|nr:hypothetical protein [Desulfovibrio piger]
MDKQSGTPRSAGRKTFCPEGDQPATCSIRVCVKTHERLKAWCKEHGVEKSSLINSLISDFLENKQ